VSTSAPPPPHSPPPPDFDLDVRLEPLARAVGREEGQRATEVTCVKSACTTNEFTCHC
jgi:hypothetical protein